MILIADSGSTKTDWCILNSANDYKIFQTEGINPFLQDSITIAKSIKETLLPQIKDCIIKEVFFYGAGCTPEKSYIVEEAIKNVIGDKASISVKSDLYGAAIAACGNKPGIAAILGTGSNSCQYDGKDITDKIPALGFILGDEGGGAYIGKRFISDCMKKQLPDSIFKEFLNEYHLSQEEIINRVYREPFANRFLAGFLPFIAKKREEKSIKALLNNCFTEFFKRNILHYDLSYDINFVGSVAYFFQKELKEAASAYNLSVGKIIKTPMDGLIEYHSSTSLTHSKATSSSERDF